MKTLADNNVTILFAYDFEHLPAFNIDYFIQSFEWFYSMLIEHGNTNLKFNFLTTSNVTDNLSTFFKNYFNNSIRFIYSPLIFMTLRNCNPPGYDEKEVKLLDKNFASGVLDQYFMTDKVKQFTSLSRNPRYLRDIMLHGLRASNLLGEGYISRNTTTLQPYKLLSNQFTSDYANKKIGRAHV